VGVFGFLIYNRGGHQACFISEWNFLTQIRAYLGKLFQVLEQAGLNLGIGSLK
jgi:hypothetical protein